MNHDEWKAQWRRLDHFHVSGDANRADLSAEWYRQLRHWHVDAVEYGITQLIGTAKDTFLPGLGLLKDYIQSRIDRYDRTGKCGVCGGSGWVDGAPFISNGLVYANAVTRCTACGIPAPKVDAHARRQPLTDLQDHEYRAGRYGREQMPEGLQAKSEQPGNPELKAAFASLREKLFGVKGEVA